MQVKYIPEGYHTITPYVVIQGLAKLITFLKEGFDAIEIRKIDLPDGSVTHAELKIGDSMVMFSESKEGSPPRAASFYLYVKDTDMVYKKALDAGGISLMEPVDQYYGDRNAGIKDPSGNIWYIATHFEDLTSEELMEREKQKKK